MTTPEEGRYLEKPRKGELSHLFDFEHDGMGSNEVGVARGSLVYKWFTNWHRRGSIENFYIFTFLQFTFLQVFWFYPSDKTISPKFCHICIAVQGPGDYMVRSDM